MQPTASAHERQKAPTSTPDWDDGGLHEPVNGRERPHQTIAPPRHGNVAAGPEYRDDGWYRSPCFGHTI